MSRLALLLAAIAALSGCEQPMSSEHFASLKTTPTADYAYGVMEGKCELIQQVAERDDTYKEAAVEICALSKRDEAKIAALWSGR